MAEDKGNTVIIRLAQLIEGHPCLYDHGREDYGDEEVTSAAWEAVSEELKLPVVECKDMWMSTKEQYLCLLKKGSPSGSGTKRQQFSFLTDFLHFINPYLVSEPETDNKAVTVTNANSENNVIDMEDKKEVITELPSSNEPIIPNQIDATPNMNTSFNNTSSVSSLEQLNIVATRYFNERKLKKISEKQDLDFFKSLLPDMYSLNPSIKRKLRIKILELVNDACNESALNQISSVTSPENQHARRMTTMPFRNSSQQFPPTNQRPFYPFNLSLGNLPYIFPRSSRPSQHPLQSSTVQQPSPRFGLPFAPQHHPYHNGQQTPDRQP